MDFFRLLHSCKESQKKQKKHQKNGNEMGIYSLIAAFSRLTAIIDRKYKDKKHAKN